MRTVKEIKLFEERIKSNKKQENYRNRKKYNLVFMRKHSIKISMKKSPVATRLFVTVLFKKSSISLSFIFEFNLSIIISASA